MSSASTQNAPTRRHPEPLDEQHHQRGGGGEHDRGGERHAVVQLARVADQPEDHDRQRRVVLAGEERGGAELAQRHREREPGRGQQRPPQHRQVDGERAPAAGRRRATRRPGAAGRRSPASTGTRVRTTSGSATSAWAIGTSSGESRKSSGGSSRVIRKPKPRVTAETPSGSMKKPSSRPRTRRSAASASGGSRRRATSSAEQQRHPGRVDRRPQRVDQRVGDRAPAAPGRSRRSCSAAVVGQAPRAVDPQRPDDERGDRRPRPGPRHQARDQRGRQVAADGPPGRRGRPRQATGSGTARSRPARAAAR